MSTRTGLRAVAVAGLLLASSLIAMPASSAATTLKVPVGAPLFALPEANGAPADGMRFYAPPLSVHKNDVILFSMQGFHSATLLPAGVDADQWVAGNALGFGKPYSLRVPDPDEGPAGVKVNNAVALPPASGCGDATNPCSYDGSQIVNSGLFPQNPNANEFDFSVTINADAGDTFTVLCLVHLAMRLDITVVADTETTTTQEGIDAFATQKYARDARRASRLHQELLATVPSSGRGVLDAFVGYDGAHPTGTPARCRTSRPTSTPRTSTTSAPAASRRSSLTSILAQGRRQVTASSRARATSRAQASREPTRA